MFGCFFFFFFKMYRKASKNKQWLEYMCPKFRANKSKNFFVKNRCGFGRYKWMLWRVWIQKFFLNF